MWSLAAQFLQTRNVLRAADGTYPIKSKGRSVPSSGIAAIASGGQVHASSIFRHAHISLLPGPTNAQLSRSSMRPR
eukprot:6179366-Amphidinium_carterae.1